MSTRPTIQIVWFKKDLRTKHNEVLARAAQQGAVLPLFIVEPELWQQPDLSARQWSFATECLAELNSELSSMGQPLIIRIGDAVETLATLQRTFTNIALWSHQETGNGWTFDRDKRVSQWARANSVEWKEIPQCGVIRGLKTRNGWAKNWGRFMAAQPPEAPHALHPVKGISSDALPSSDDLQLNGDPCPKRQPGGRSKGLRCLDSFLRTRGARYRSAMSNPATGASQCSRLSPHLAWGALSMSEVARATWRKQQDLRQGPARSSWTGSMRSFEGRLHWRDHFIQKLEDEPALEFRNLHPAYDDMRPTVPDKMLLDAWSKGETGWPFVDACMRSLNATGWMNFRMRAMLMSVASYHLWLDWRAPGEHLARQFTDYEPGIHWSQVQMQSGTTGINTARIYNPIKQGRDQDPTGDFVKTWLPELRDVPSPLVHEPWLWEGSAEVLGSAYPYPVIDHLEAAKFARKKVWAVRKVSGFREGANAIQEKHGSRKSGILHRGVRKSTPTNQNQLTLDFAEPDGQLRTSE